MKKLFLLLILTPLFSFGQLSLGQTADDYYSNGRVKSEDYQDYRGAIADFTTAIELEPNNTIFYFHRAYAKEYLENHEGAIADFTKVIEFIEVDNQQFVVETYFNRGLAKIELGEKDSGCLDLYMARDEGFGDYVESDSAIREHCNSLIRKLKYKKKIRNL